MEVAIKKKILSSYLPHGSTYLKKKKQKKIKFELFDRFPQKSLLDLLIFLANLSTTLRKQCIVNIYVNIIDVYYNLVNIKV